MQQDLSKQEDLEHLLRHFYELVLTDAIIGYLFIDIAKIDLEAHLPKVVAFWHDLIFASNDYSGGLYAAHLGVHKQVPLKPGHFARWLYLLEQAMSECGYSGANADRMIVLAHRIAKSMSAALSEQRRDTLVLSLKELSDPPHES